MMIKPKISEISRGIQSRRIVVSVFMSSYQQGPYIKKAIKSVLKQTVREIELIIIDDNSQDATWETIRSFQDSRIRAIRHQPNFGMWPIHHYWKLARGKYVALTAADDEWERNKLEKQLAILEADHSVAVCFTQATIIDKNGKNWGRLPKDQIQTESLRFYLTVFRQHNRSSAEWMHRFFFHGNCLCDSSPLIRKRIWSQYCPYYPQLLQLQDFAFWITILAENKVHILPQELVRYRFHGKNLSSGESTEAVIRLYHESIFVSMQTFFKLPSILSMRESILPSIKQWHQLKNRDPVLEVCIACLEGGEEVPVWHLKAAMVVLDNVLSDVDRMIVLERVYKRNAKWLTIKRAAIDVYGCYSGPHPIQS